MIEVRIGEEAEAEYVESLLWYQARSTKAANGFEKAFAEALDKIGQSPQQFPTCDEDGYRFALLARYPYALIYRVKLEMVQVVAVAHTRRLPGYWAGRS